MRSQEGQDADTRHPGGRKLGDTNRIPGLEGQHVAKVYTLLIWAKGCAMLMGASVCHAQCVPCSVCALLSVCHAQCVPCSLCAMLSVCLAQCVPCSVCALLSVCHALG